jgi:hypothetical protein
MAFNPYSEIKVYYSILSVALYAINALFVELKDKHV